MYEEDHVTWWIGSASIIAIKSAKDQGYYTILCDYLIDNPGQY